ncbi:hypothetical protein BDV95DRAFT_594227 [Massariosphaeria phaeospora]|uniref:Uncharacterized protein n=1 Tax=Massariosphaeria phaeospora TaxID=100035 RepID=A0A7C8MFC1_9PLEO|nr:hypothetical protein BDV95DRAFT_594227 [Massariosphaeria phaeospora]
MGSGPGAENNRMRLLEHTSLLGGLHRKDYFFVVEIVHGDENDVPSFQGSRSSKNRHRVHDPAGTNYIGSEPHGLLVSIVASAYTTLTSPAPTLCKKPACLSSIPQHVHDLPRARPCRHNRLLVQKFGRRTIHPYGTFTLFTTLLTIGGLSFSGTPASLWAIGGVLIFFVFVYQSTIGPITYSLVSKMSSTRLKAKTIVLARALYNVSTLLLTCSQTTSLEARRGTEALRQRSIGR